MTKNTCFVCLEQNNYSAKPLNTLLLSSNCKCNSLIHVRCFNKCIKFNKHNCPMCGIDIIIEDTTTKNREYALILQENRDIYQQQVQFIYQYYIIKFIYFWSIYMIISIVLYLLFTKLYSICYY